MKANMSRTKVTHSKVEDLAAAMKAGDWRNGHHQGRCRLEAGQAGRRPVSADRRAVSGTTISMLITADVELGDVLDVSTRTSSGPRAGAEDAQLGARRRSRSPGREASAAVR